MTDVRAPAARGEVIFARYAYPPNELGYCGEGDGQEWLAVASTGSPGGPTPVDHALAESARALVASAESPVPPTPVDLALAERARAFDGAWPYLQFLASIAGVADPLVPVVAEAYWVGNDLLEAVDPRVFAAGARDWFGTQAGADWDCLAGDPPSAVPHHSFHVFVIYPWVGLVRRTGSPKAIEVLDRCRIRWGTVIAVDGDSVSVRSRPLTWDGERFALGQPQLESARWAANGQSLLPAVQPGQVVSLHWGWVCDVLTPVQQVALRTYTARQLALTNRTAPKDPAPSS